MFNFSIFKRVLIKYLAREIAQELKKHFNSTAENKTKNLAGVGGQKIRANFISWGEIISQHPDRSNLQRWYNHGETSVVKEQLFFEYFGPIEHWCDENCTSEYYLWTDRLGVYKAFTSEVDRVLWNLTFQDKMPTLKEVEQLVQNNTNSREDLE